MKNNVTVRMSAMKFTADVRVGESVVNFDLRKMSKEQERHWIKTLVRSFRESRLAA
jgi:hypothetical protein